MTNSQFWLELEQRIQLNLDCMECVLHPQLENYLFMEASLTKKTKFKVCDKIDYFYIQNSSNSCFIGDTIFIYGGGQSRNMVAEKSINRGCAAFHPKSLYIGHAMSNFYGTEIEIWAGFGPVGNTEKKLGANYEQLLRPVFSCFRDFFFKYCSI